MAVGSQVSFAGCLIQKTTNQSIPASTVTYFAWDTEIYDIGGFRDNVTNPTRITIPAGISRVQLFAQVDWTANSTGTRNSAIPKNGAGTYPGVALDERAASVSSTQPFATPVLEVEEGDYFEVSVYQRSGGALNVDAVASTSFAMRVVTQSYDQGYQPICRSFRIDPKVENCDAERGFDSG